MKIVQKLVHDLDETRNNNITAEQEQIHILEHLSSLQQETDQLNKAFKSLVDEYNEAQQTSKSLESDIDTLTKHHNKQKQTYQHQMHQLDDLRMRLVHADAHNSHKTQGLGQL